MTTIRRTTGVSLLTTLLVVSALAAAPAAASGTSYGYFRTLEGSATQTQATTGERTPVEVHQPILVGDSVWVARGSRVEIVLPDRNRIRLDGRTEVAFDRLAYSADSDDRQTLLRLLEGNLQITVVEDALGESLPRVDAPNASVHLLEPGRYRVTADAADWSQAVVRDGLAEVVTQRGAAVLQMGEEALVEGARLPRTIVRAATVEDSLERWAVQLESLAAAAEVRHVDRALEYEAAPLARYGSWVQVDRSWAWRPAVSVTWQPYWRGRWVYTPSGLTWVSYEPWGRVTYHYGTWDYAPGYGWVWFPGTVYAPAWVYWYWGPSYVGWCPIGYYSRFYHPRFARVGFGFRFGVHGWAGGSWGHYQRWLFVPAGRVGDRHVPAHARRGADMRQRLDRGQMSRGVLTTDTRAVKPHLWSRPQEAVDTLVRQPVARGEVRSSHELPDVTDFVARRPQLSEPVTQRVARPLGEGRVSAQAPMPPTRARALERPESATGRPEGALAGRQPLSRPSPGEPTETRRTDGGVAAGDDWRQGVRRPVGRDAGAAGTSTPTRGGEPGVSTRPGRGSEPEGAATTPRRIGQPAPESGGDQQWRGQRRQIPSASPSQPRRTAPAAPPRGIDRGPRRDAASEADSSVSTSPGQRPVVRRVIDGARSGSGARRTPPRVAPRSRPGTDASAPRAGDPSSPRGTVGSPSSGRRSGDVSRPSTPRRPASTQSAPQGPSSRETSSRGGRSSQEGSTPRRRSSSDSGGG